MEFSLHNLDNKIIHLTNDAIQIQSNSYGKYETGNKGFIISYLFQNFNNIWISLAHIMVFLLIEI